MLCAPFLSPSSQARVILGIAVVDSFLAFISSLQWLQRISTIQLRICLLTNLNTVILDFITEHNFKKVSIFNDEKTLKINKFQYKWVFMALHSPRPPLPPSNHCHIASVYCSHLFIYLFIVRHLLIW